MKEITNRKSRKAATRVDLTAMVDLGFLLITFFMLATSFSKPKSMKILQPDESGRFDYPESKMATIVIGSRDKVYVYNLPDKLESLSDFHYDSLSLLPGGLRTYIRKRQDEVEDLTANRNDLFVVIKPLPGSSYKNMIDVLDEMLINDVKHYAIVKPVLAIDSLLALHANESMY